MFVRVHQINVLIALQNYSKHVSMICQIFRCLIVIIFYTHFIIKLSSHKITNSKQTLNNILNQILTRLNLDMDSSQQSPTLHHNEFDYKVKQIFNPKSQHYFSKLLHINGKNLFGMQTSHVMVMYFIIQGLASTDSLKKIDKQLIISYIKSLQLPRGGFGPSSLFTNYENDHQFNLPHIVFTYSAINILKNLNSLSVINKQKCLNSISLCLKQNGSFSNFSNSNEADLRFVYAGLAICHALDDFSEINKQKVKEYINSCYNYDGGYGLRPYCESHCGAIYCAIASYKLLGYQIQNKQATLQFLVNRQTINQSKQLNNSCSIGSRIVGVQGRVGKLPDSCYTFWVGAAVKIICGENLLNENIQKFLQICYNQQSFTFSKYPYSKGDPLHTLHSTVGLKILRGQDQSINLIQGTTNYTLQE